MTSAYNAKLSILCVNFILFCYKLNFILAKISWIPLDDGPLQRATLPQPSVCGRIGLTPRIFGGTHTEIDEYPWMAMIVYKNIKNGAMGSYCAGSLINHFYVLTAGHCVDVQLNTKMGYTLTEVRLGEWDAQTNLDCMNVTRGKPICAPPTQNIPVLAQILHPNYNQKNMANDIAILQLSKRAVYTDFVSPICLPVAGSQQLLGYANVSAEVSGWGKTEKAASSRVKKKATVKVRELADCTDRMINEGTDYKIVYYSFLQSCAMGDDTNACKGDTGGPLMIRDTQLGKEAYYLIGIASFGFDKKTCHRKGYPSIFVRVVPYLDWIQETIKRG